jgi:hypothetical protein
MMCLRALTGIVIVGVAALAPVVAGQSGSAGTPIRTIKDGVLDEIVVYVEPQAPAPGRAVIRQFSATDTDLGSGGKDGKDSRKSEAKMMQEQGPKMLAEHFVAKLKELGPFTDVASAEAGSGGVADALVVDGKFTGIDPGSQAKRYLVGFGAGKSSVSVSGTLTAPDGTRLATFAQRRIGVMGVAGGDSLQKLLSDTKSIGEDLAKFVSAWANRKSLK